jgi:6-phosphogluconolactonase
MNCWLVTAIPGLPVVNTTINPMPAEVKIYLDRSELASAAAEHFIDQAIIAIETKGTFRVALAGGSTPKATYSLLASTTYAGRLDWKLVHFFWGDERCVPPDHAYSNFRMAREALLDHIPIPASNIHRMRGENIPDQAARDYENELRGFFQQSPFDLILLGLGDDGHTASLFPNSPVLQETNRWVRAVEHNRPPPPLVTRLTLTLPIINSASQVTFLASGESKSQRLEQIFTTQFPTEITLPAQLVQPVSGNLLWLVDQAAAGVH